MTRCLSVTDSPESSCYISIAGCVSRWAAIPPGQRRGCRHAGLGVAHVRSEWQGFTFDFRALCIFQTSHTPAQLIFPPETVPSSFTEDARFAARVRSLLLPYTQPATGRYAVGQQVLDSAAAPPRGPHKVLLGAAHREGRGKCLLLS